MIRPLLRKLRHFYLQARTRIRRRLGLLESDRESGLAEEGNFWAHALRDGGRNWNVDDYNERMNPALPLQPELRALIAAPPGATVRILDVGAGPLTRVGRVWEERTVEIVPVDPLAAEYDRILADLRLTPPVRTIAGEGEKLAAQFPAGSFDLAYASNSLDHAHDPVAAIRQMLAVVKPGGHAYLWHFAEAAVIEEYQGLHAWNFTARDGDMLISDGRKTLSLREQLQPQATVEATDETGYGGRVVVARIRKAAAPAS